MDRADAADDRLVEGEFAPDVTFRASIEKRPFDRRLDLAREMTPRRYRSDREDREGDQLRLPGPVDRDGNRANNDGRQPEPHHETARRHDLQQEQQHRQDEPVPGAERDHPGDQLAVHRTRPQACGPALGTVGRRAGGGALPSPPWGSPPNVALTISPMPAS